MNSNQKNLIISEIIQTIAQKPVSDLTEIHNALVPQSGLSERDKLVSEILAKIIHLSDEHLVSLKSSNLEVNQLDIRADFIKKIKLKLKNALPGTTYHEFFDQPRSSEPNHHRMSGHLLMQVINLAEFESLINWDFLTRQDLKHNDSEILVYLAERGKLDYFQFLSNHPKDIFLASDITANNCQLIQQACKFNQFELADWLINRYNQIVSPQKFDLKFGRNFLIRIAATHGNLPFLIKLKESTVFQPTCIMTFGEQAVKNAMFNRHHEVAKFLEQWVQSELPGYQLPSNRPTMSVEPEYFSESEISSDNYGDWLTESDIGEDYMTMSEISGYNFTIDSESDMTESEPIILDNFDHLIPVAVEDCKYNGICPICRNHFLHYQNDKSIAMIRLSLTPCQHLFHQKCLEYAIRTQTTDLECPSCKQLIKKDLNTFTIPANSTLSQACDMLKNTNSFSLGCANC